MVHRVRADNPPVRILFSPALSPTSRAYSRGEGSKEREDAPDRPELVELRLCRVVQRRRGEDPDVSAAQAHGGGASANGKEVEAREGAARAAGRAKKASRRKGLGMRATHQEKVHTSLATWWVRRGRAQKDEGQLDR